LARRQGFPRNLGDPVISTPSSDRIGEPDKKQPWPGRPRARGPRELTARAGRGAGTADRP